MNARHGGHRDNAQEEVISIRNLSFSYSGESPLILQDIDLSVSSGEFVCFLGQSGCGKSTLLRLLAGLEKPSAGEILLNGQKITGAGL
ncbi:MAG: ATP-binding cassette domain-containing protein, partial [Synergistaceae bacterium]|nr:ATP-binding cassette domain-containing protein [Synergistaceae bacterium]